MIYSPLRWIGSLPRILLRFNTSATKIFEIINEKIDVPDHENVKNIKIKGTIDFEDASFGYDQTTDLLKRIDLHIEPGEMIGIVGKSGVGKSTLIHLLMRIYDVGDGCIKIDGTDLRNIT